MGGKRLAAALLLTVPGVVLTWDSANAWKYMGSINIGIVVSLFSGLFFLAFAVKTALTDRPMIKSSRVRALLRRGAMVCLVVFTMAEGLIISGPYLFGAEPAEEADYLIVLGCRIWPDGRPTLALVNRLDRAVEYYSRNPDVKIIVSGGQGSDEPMPEAEAMAEYLVAKGIPEDSIIRETRSSSTMENFRFSRALISEDFDEPVKLVFVTSDFHVLRARILAGRNGFKAYAISAPTPPVILLNSYIREFFALVKSMLVDY